MNACTFNAIVGVINDYRGLSRNCLKVLEQKFQNVPPSTLNSILTLECQKRMKINYTKYLNQKLNYYEDYIAAVHHSESPGIIIRIAQKYDVTPCLVAKLILQKYLEDHDDCDENNISMYLRDTTLIPNMDLAYEVFLCTLYGDLYSPMVEVMKHSLGQQYEIKLHKEVVRLGLAFRDEQHLRKFGYDKTPDVKLEVPVAVDGFVINWIESKALFGTADVHKDYMKNQYLCYWNRFGPGLVIYWFGYLETIADCNDKRFIVRDHLPSNIIQLSSSNVSSTPTGTEDNF